MTNMLSTICHLIKLERNNTWIENPKALGMCPSGLVLDKYLSKARVTVWI